MEPKDSILFNLKKEALYFAQFIFADFTSLELPPTIIANSPVSQSFFFS